MQKVPTLHSFSYLLETELLLTTKFYQQQDPLKGIQFKEDQQQVKDQGEGFQEGF